MDGELSKAFQTVDGSRTRNQKPTSSLPTGRPTLEATVFVKDLISEDINNPANFPASDYITSPTKVGRQDTRSSATRARTISTFNTYSNWYQTARNKPPYSRDTNRHGKPRRAISLFRNNSQHATSGLISNKDAGHRVENNSLLLKQKLQEVQQHLTDRKQLFSQ